MLIPEFSIFMNRYRFLNGPPYLSWYSDLDTAAPFLLLRTMRSAAMNTLFCIIHIFYTPFPSSPHNYTLLHIYKSCFAMIRSCPMVSISS